MQPHIQKAANSNCINGTWSPHLFTVFDLKKSNHYDGVHFLPVNYVTGTVVFFMFFFGFTFAVSQR